MSSPISPRAADERTAHAAPDGGRDQPFASLDLGRSLRVAVLMLQSDCNMSCSFCVTENNMQPMGYERAVELLDELVRHGVRSVVLGGGEPFTWPGNVLTLAEQAKARGLLVQIGTNGVALPDGFADLKQVDRWVLPLESIDPAVHQTLRVAEGGHHAIILGRLAELSQARRSVTLSTVLTTVNLAGLMDLARFLSGYHAGASNVHAWHLYQFLPLGRGGARNREQLAIGTQAYRAACDQVRAAGMPFKVFRRSDMYRSRSVEFFWCEGGRLHSGSEALHASHPAASPSPPG